MNMLSRLPAYMMLATALGGCVPRSYQADPQFGVAVREDRAIQTINPAGIPVSGLQGLDGASGKAVMDRYLATFITPPPPTSAFSMGFGSGGSTPMTVPAALGTNPPQ